MVAFSSVFKPRKLAKNETSWTSLCNFFMGGCRTPEKGMVKASAASAEKSQRSDAVAGTMKGLVDGPTQCPSKQRGLLGFLVLPEADFSSTP